METCTICRYNIILFHFSEVHNVSFTPGATTTICQPSINYKACSHPAMKLSFHPQTSNSDIGELLYNEVYRRNRSDDLCTRSTTAPAYKMLNTTAYGIHNITSTCNQSALCIYFHEMSAPADGRVFSIDQICGVTLIHLENEYRFKFRLGK